MVAAKSLAAGLLVVAINASFSASAGEIISAGSGSRIFFEKRMASSNGSVRPVDAGYFVRAGSIGQAASMAFGPPPAAVASVPASPFLAASTPAVSVLAAPAPAVVAPPLPPPVVPQPSTPFDAFVNFGTAPYAGLGTLASGEARPWYTSDSVTRAYGYAPSAQEVQDFSNAVLDRVATTFAQSGLSVSLTADPTAPADHMLSVASGLYSASSPGAVGIASVGRDGFSFIDKLAYANSADELIWAVAHNVAHELMHTFGGSHHTTPEGNNLDSAVSDWSVLIDPSTKFSAEAVAEIARNLRQGGLATQGGQSAEMLGHHLTCPCTQCQILHVNGVPVPEPATLALWGAMAGLAGLVRARARRAS